MGKAQVRGKETHKGHPDHIETDCSTSEQDLYDINIQVAPEEGWETFRVCSGYTDLGYQVCKGLEAQGFEPVDAH